MKSNQMCSYSNIQGYLPGHPGVMCGLDEHTEKFFASKNKRVRCPVCGRSMWAARRTCHDGCCEMYCVPPHKKKGWWKKPKKQSRDLKMKRR